jgi:mannose-6-phosphate isomerase
MDHIFKLKNPIKHYAWGSPDWIPRILGLDNKEKIPWAELWMGIHPEGPSEIVYEGKSILLSELINKEPSKYLGEETYSRFGTLPFLFKLLAAGTPLSIQAHPSLAQARAGFERENQRGIPLKALNRNYKDPNHKPEILCALSDVRALCGFRDPLEITKRLDGFAQFMPGRLQALLDSLSRHLKRGEKREARLRTFFRALFDLSPASKEELSAGAISFREALLKQYPTYTVEWDLLAYLAELYPGDPGVFAPLYLNVIDLHPEQGIYIPAGILHGYIAGFGVELMANSDNVLRGGLTSKHVDLEELLRIVDFAPFFPAILSPQGSTFPTSCKEFALSVLKQDVQYPDFLGNNGIDYPSYVGRVASKDLISCFMESGPYIVIVTQGKLTIHYKNSEEVCTLEQGESAFIPVIDNPGDITLSGAYTLYAAGIGAP